MLLSYLGQYRIEHAFRLMKDGMHMSRVYIHRPSRENAMMFIISLGTMLTGVMDHVLKERDFNITATGIRPGPSDPLIAYADPCNQQRELWLVGNNSERSAEFTLYRSHLIMKIHTLL